MGHHIVSLFKYFCDNVLFMDKYWNIDVCTSTEIDFCDYVTIDVYWLEMIGATPHRDHPVAVACEFT
jgi:hypothetical protein